MRARVGRTHWRRGRIRPSAQTAHRLPLVPDTWQVSGRQRGSRLLHRLGDFSAHAAAGLFTGTAVIVWLIIGAVVGFATWWVTVLEIASACVTLVMVFAIQHTQSRQQSATQRKLDELLRALPTADDRLIAVEEAPDAELEALADLNLSDRQAADAAFPQPR